MTPFKVRPETIKLAIEANDREWSYALTYRKKKVGGEWDAHHSVLREKLDNLLRERG